jgi:hypothetical protein
MNPSTSLSWLALAALFGEAVREGERRTGGFGTSGRGQIWQVLVGGGRPLGSAELALSVDGLGNAEWAGLLSFLSEALNNLQLPTLLLP